MTGITPYFNEVSKGYERALFKGPLTAMHLMRWSAAMENWHRIHYDRDFAVGHDGLPERLINGSLKQQFLMQLLKDWAGPQGWVWKVAFQFRAMNLVGEQLRVWLRVTDTRALSAYGLIHLDVGMTNEQAMESTPGRAIVALPLRGGLALPYPFVPPENTSAAVFSAARHPAEKLE